MTKITRRLTALGILALAAGLASPASARMYGDGAPQNVPIAEIPIDQAATDLYATKLWNGGGGRAGLSQVPLTYRDWTYPRYALEDAERNCRIQVAHKDWGSNLDGAIIPFRPHAWVPSHGWYPGKGYDDSQIILQGQDGTEYDLWQVRQPVISRKRGTCTITIGNGNKIPIDWTSSNRIGFPSSRGSGTPYSSMLVLATEIQAGLIEHALPIVVSNSDPKLFRAPGTKTDGQVANGIPEGTRFGLRLTPERIESWLARQPSCVTEGQRNGLRAIATAAMQYGLISVDQTGGGTHLQLEDENSGGAVYRASGFLPETSCNGVIYPRHALNGLLLGVADIYVVEPFAGR